MFPNAISAGASVRKLPRWHKCSLKNHQFKNDIHGINNWKTKHYGITWAYTVPP